MQSWVVVFWALLVLVGADECPDGGTCKEGHTCCSSPTDGYQCCPSDQAECCEDHIHCCPADTSCDTATSSCVNATASIPWMKRASTDRNPFSKSFRMIRTSTSEDYDTVCPDQSRCPAEFSCLRALTKFGCCPVEKGVSCSDGKHCCPDGHHCSVDSRSCVRKESAATVLCDDGVSECPEDTTCCESPEGKWGCCPLPKAVCCNDKKHCCAEGTTCDTKNMKCILTSTKSELPMWAKFPARLRADWENQKAKDVPCNDTAACPDGTTCCKNKEGGWSCCPIPEAVCCKDLEHCCPHGKTCNLETMTCEGSTGSSPLVKKIPSISRKDIQAHVKDVPCNDTAACPDGTTCCKNKEGGWSCCPIPEAVCCKDLEHCCPHGKTCNLETMTCEGSTGSSPLVKKIPSISRKDIQAHVKDVPCNDTAACPDGTTCCKNKEGGWSCCPIPEAVCCKDLEHCCPHGKTCNLETMTCEGSTGSSPLVKKIPSISRKDIQAHVKDVPCNDTAACPDGTTCCKNKEGGWSCCPIPEAVCCKDLEHCCPHGKTCNLETMTCEGSTGSSPLVKKIPSISRKDIQAHVKDVPCNDTAACPDGTTCCKNKEGGWSCCPIPEAVCCKDLEHCCPHGKTCNLETMTCEGSTGSSPLVKKIPSISRKDIQAHVKDVPCNDTAACPDGTTCCKNKEGGWSCCPIPEAVCCKDLEHCCPHGKTCNLETMTCEGSTGSSPLVKKIPSISRKDIQAHVKDVPCNDTAACPDGTTCCKNKEGGWSCCPIPEAVCCKDLEHCCPHGKTCNLETMTCEGSTGSSPLVKKIPSISRKDIQAHVKDVPCNDTAACPDGTTCCKNKEGGWSCCPIPEAVCCKDLEHCCPHGKTCNLETMTCEGSTGSSPLVKKIPSISRKDIQAHVKDVPCNDTAACPDGTTCCKNKEGGWSCCPIPEAVCCKDLEHCCPHGKTCNLETMTCEDSTGSSPLVKKIPSISRKDIQAHVKDVPCNDTAACPDGTTCCKNKEGGWSCCPIPEAVCCKDLEHCCPHGKTCNLETMTCEGSTGSSPLVKKIPSISRKDIQAHVKDVPCNDTAACPDGTTCCKNKEGGWSCCPIPEAVCCKDLEHCCPHGKTCNLETMTCEDSTGSSPLVKKIPSISRKDIQAHVKDVPCNDTAACPDGTTCCKNKEGGWSCCPIPEAVCCKDLEHCCPHGKTCNLETMTCEDSTGSSPLVKKIPSISRKDIQAHVKDVPCNDTAACPDGTTCCKNKEGGWSCCPIPEAVCCKDLEHCCPHGKTCNLETMTCEGSKGFSPLVKKMPSISRKDIQAHVKDVPCNDTAACPDGTTCCKNKEGGWSCCPIPEAVCCKDLEHCCPHGKTCNLETMTCEGSTGSSPLVKKIPSISRKDIQAHVKDVPCNDTAACPDGTTCCKNKEGGWSCCPTPEAVCCSDGTHCCPAHYKCKEDQTSCIKDEVVIPWYSKVPATTGDQDDSSSIKCDHKTKCHKHSSCCKLSTGKWGCCPLKNAVCCSDRKHCCPAGSTCSDEGSCIQNMKANWNTWNLFFTKKKAPIL